MADRTTRGTSGRRAGSRPVVMREVADRAGVALSSVSRVLSGHPDVSPVMRNRVLDAVAALNYQPNLLAQSLRTGSTMTTGFLVADISNPFMSQVALGAEVELRAAGYGMLLTNSFNEIEQDVAHVQLLAQRRVDGLLLSLSDEVDHELRDTIDSLDLPLVLVDRQLKGSSYAAVLSDHASGMESLVALLAGLGHRDIALVNDSRQVRPSRERAAAFRRACKAARITGTVHLSSLSRGEGYVATRGLLSDPGRPTAVVAGSNQILVGVLDATRELGLDIPGDLSVATCDDFDLSGYAQITMVYRDSREIGRTAASLLLEQLADEPPRSVTLPTELRPTTSCAAPPHVRGTRQS
jgi:LacI family transcriptional regulator